MNNTNLAKRNSPERLARCGRPSYCDASHLAALLVIIIIIIIIICYCYCCNHCHRCHYHHISAISFSIVCTVRRCGVLVFCGTPTQGLKNLRLKDSNCST